MKFQREISQKFQDGKFVRVYGYRTVCAQLINQEWLHIGLRPSHCSYALVRNTRNTSRQVSCNYAQLERNWQQTRLCEPSILLRKLLTKFMVRILMYVKLAHGVLLIQRSIPQCGVDSIFWHENKTLTLDQHGNKIFVERVIMVTRLGLFITQNTQLNQITRFNQITGFAI